MVLRIIAAMLGAEINTLLVRRSCPHIIFPFLKIKIISTEVTINQGYRMNRKSGID